MLTNLLYEECYTMNIIDEVPFDELVSLINSLSDEKSKRILLSKAADVYDNGDMKLVAK